MYFTETGLADNFLHHFSLREGTDAFRQISVGAVVFRNTFTEQGDNDFGVMVNSCFIGKRSGVESSSMTRCPPAVSTRHISDSPLSSPSKLRMPNATVTASKLSSANEREVQSSRANEILSERCARFTFSRPRSSCLPRCRCQSDCRVAVRGMQGWRNRRCR